MAHLAHEEATGAMEDNNRNDLTPEQVVTLHQFAEITHITDENLCRSILFQNDWNLEVAVDNFVRGTDSNRNSVASSMSPPSSYRGSRRNGNRNAPVVPGVFDMIISPLRWLFQTHPESLNPVEDCRRHLADFTNAYGHNGPVFRECSYNQAIAAAFRQSKLLLVYLHSPMHDETSKFCREVLYSDRVAQLMNTSLLAWTGSVFDAEAYALTSQLHVAAFPFVCIMICQSERVVQVVDRIQGFTEEPTFYDRLLAAIQLGSASVSAARDQQLEREANVQLREEQDAEFLAALEADRRAQEMKRNEEEQKRRAEEEALEKQQTEEAMKLSESLAKEARITRIKSSLDAEPSSADAATIRFQLPAGNKISRKFLKSDPLQKLADFLELHLYENNIEMRILMSTNFPKRDLTDLSMTVEEAGLYPRGVLFVQDLDA